MRFISNLHSGIAKHPNFPLDLMNQFESLAEQLALALDWI